MRSDWSNSGVDLHLELDRSLGRRDAVEQALRRAVQDGRLPAGARIPASRALAVELGLSRGTVTAAYEQLVAEGFLVSVVGSGTVVADAVRPSSPPAEAAGERSWTHDLSAGAGDVSSFPVGSWLRAGRRALTRAPAASFDYGSPAGQPELRRALAGYLGRARGVTASPEAVVVTNGFVQALSLLAAAGRGPVAMEDPCLAFHRRVVEAQGRRVVPLPVDEHGARTDLLAAPAYEGVRMVVVTPAHQFPMGVALDATRRRALVEWARATGRLVVEDDYDGEFRYDRQPVGALQAMAPDHVAYVGTASKTLAPAVRIAWMVPPPGIRDKVLRQKEHTGGHTEALGQLTLADLVDSHEYDRHVRLMRTRYRHRRDQFLTVLERRTGRHARGLVPGGIAAGLQAVVRISDEAAVLERAAARDLRLTGLTECYHRDRGERPPGVVLGFARGTPGSYARALEVFMSVLA
jgi:GntR family transcriptional regulator/MocR family aminotransferase